MQKLELTEAEENKITYNDGAIANLKTPEQRYEIEKKEYLKRKKRTSELLRKAREKAKKEKNKGQYDPYKKKYVSDYTEAEIEKAQDYGNQRAKKF